MLIGGIARIRFLINDYRADSRLLFARVSNKEASADRQLPRPRDTRPRFVFCFLPCER